MVLELGLGKSGVRALLMRLWQDRGKSSYWVMEFIGGSHIDESNTVYAFIMDKRLKM